MTEDEELIQRVRLLPPSKRKRVIARLKAVPESAKELWANTGRFDKSGSGEHFLKVRVDMLEAAKWDPAGWSVMEWDRLPSKLRKDLDEVFPTFQSAIREESRAVLKRLVGAGIED